jgi:excisionase family DNA binding protein
MLYPVPEAAAQLGIGRSTLYELVRKGELDVVRIGSRTLIPASSLERYIAGRTAADNDTA